MTNGDRIRAMSDAELIKVFRRNGLCIHIQTNCAGYCESRAVCTNCLEEWLQQPAEEEAP